MATGNNDYIGKDDYIKIINRMACTDGLEIANTVNHKAYESKKIPYDWFRDAAHELARRIIER